MLLPLPLFVSLSIHKSPVSLSTTPIHTAHCPPTLTAAAQHAAAAVCVPVKADELLKVQPVGSTQLRHAADAAAGAHLRVAAVGVHNDKVQLATL